MVFEATVSHQPFRPTSSESISPYSLVENYPLEYPGVGIDGGIIIPAKLLSREVGTPLGDYLSQRFMTVPDSEIYAVTHNTQGHIRVHRAQDENLATSRGLSYYDMNYGFDRQATKAERKERLRRNLEQDATILREWGNVQESLNKYDQETRWRLTAGILQNITTDLIGLDYYGRIAASFDPDLETPSANISREIFEAVTAYYQFLLHPKEGINMDHMSFAKNAHHIFNSLSSSQVPDHIDDIRTAREADTTYLTLAGARTFLNEFGVDGTSVIIPLLGAYDMGPALRAIGYQGEIHYVLPAQKSFSEPNVDGTLRRKTTLNTNVTAPLPSHLKENPVILLDDSLGTGMSALRLMERLRNEAGIYPFAIRTLYMNDEEGPDWRKEFVEVYGSIFRSYFRLPLRRKWKSAVDTGGQPMIARAMTDRWIKLHNT